jgi:flavin-binding protein dodecin
VAVKLGEYTGYSDSSIEDAIQNALQKAEHTYFEIIETRATHASEDKRTYQVTLSLFAD